MGSIQLVGRHLLDGHTERVHVGRGRRHHPGEAQELRRHVDARAGRASRGERLGDGRRLVEADLKVGETRPPRGIHEHVLGLDVAMDAPLLMNMRHHGGQLVQDRAERACRRSPLGRATPRTQRATFHVRHLKVELISLLEELLHLEHARVVQPAHEHHLLVADADGGVGDWILLEDHRAAVEHAAVHGVARAVRRDLVVEWVERACAVGAQVLLQRVDGCFDAEQLGRQALGHKGGQLGEGAQVHVQLLAARLERRLGVVQGGARPLHLLPCRLESTRFGSRRVLALRPFEFQIGFRVHIRGLLGCLLCLLEAGAMLIDDHGRSAADLLLLALLRRHLATQDTRAAQGGDARAQLGRHKGAHVHELGAWARRVLVKVAKPSRGIGHEGGGRVG